jgi:hypothetical protein
MIADRIMTLKAEAALLASVLLPLAKTAFGAA